MMSSANSTAIDVMDSTRPDTAHTARLDGAFMAAAIRLSRWHSGQTGTNPSVATLIVDASGVIVGRGVTAIGGRPHAEPIALAEAGERARGATAYVTLEPCAHHGRTPPCAEALISAGVARVVGGASDPDPRVSGKGYAMLRGAGVEVIEGVLADQAADAMSDYLIRSFRKRPEVILKMAVSADGMIGRKGEGQVAITGRIARDRVHVMRSTVHAIMVGGGTARADNPELTCRLPGLEGRSPIRIVVGKPDSLAPGSRLLETSATVPVWLAPSAGSSRERLAALSDAGIRILPVEIFDGDVALPELLEDLGQKGIMSVLVEGGAALARSLLEDRLVDRIVLFEGSDRIGADGIAAPLVPGSMPANFRLANEEMLGKDRCREWIREDRF